MNPAFALWLQSTRSARRAAEVGLLVVSDLRATMAHRTTWYSKTGVLFVSLLLGFATAHALFETPNMVGGSEAKMIAGLVLMIFWKVMIEFVRHGLRRDRADGRHPPRDRRR